MRECLILLLFVSYSSFAQIDYTEELTGNQFIISGLDLENSPSYEEGDTIHMSKKSGLGALYFKKNNSLKMLQVYRWCGTMSFFQALKILIPKHKDYQKSFNGMYKYIREEKKLILNYRGSSHSFHIIELCHNRITGFSGFDLRYLGSE